MKHCIILGTRPEIIKMSPVIREMIRRSLDYFIIHTNQHYSEKMDSLFFKELGLPKPKYNLDIGSGSHGEQTGRMIIAIEKILMREKPDHLYVEGDTNTVVAGAMAAAKELSIKVTHVEAGLRSYDRTMPEEINRVIADHIADFLFAPTSVEKSLLLKEGVPRSRIFVVGNTIVDAVQQNSALASKRRGVLNAYHLKRRQYSVLTLHRPSNVDNPATLKELLHAIDSVNKEHGMTTLFPCHPRTKKQIHTFRVPIGRTIRIIEPTGYLDMLQLLQQAKLILTDSGGIQEEACILRIPCVTLRDNTERPETIRVGGNILAGNKKRTITKAVRLMLNKKVRWKNPFGNGHTASAILDVTSRS